MVDFLGIQIINFKEINFLKQVNRPVIVNCLNAWSFYCFFHNKYFKNAILNTYNLPDGMSIVYSNQLINQSTLKRFTGYDLLKHVLVCGQDCNYRKLMFVGSTEKVQRLIKYKLEKEFPLLESNFVTLPFKESFNENDIRSLKNEISNFKPDVIFVGLSAPKQEIFSHTYLRHLSDVKLICNIGAAFDFFAGTETRAPQWIQNIGFEGLFRTSLNPLKHIKKDLISYPFLIKKIIQQKFNINEI